MSDESQIWIPPSFIALFVPEGRMKPSASRQEIAQQYEVCEDLATALTDKARTVQWELGVAEHDVLARIHQGLCAPESAIAPAQALWVVRRLAELLEWGDFVIADSLDDAG